MNSDLVIAFVGSLFSHYMFSFGMLVEGFCVGLFPLLKPSVAQPTLTPNGSCLVSYLNSKRVESPFFLQKLLLLLGYHFLLLDLEPSRPAASALFTVSCFYSIQTLILYSSMAVSSVFFFYVLLSSVCSWRRDQSMYPLRCLNNLDCPTVYFIML